MSLMSKLAVDRGGLSSKMTRYKKGCKGLGSGGAQAIGSKRTSVGGKKTRRPGSDCVRGRVEEALALETLALIVEGGREGARMIISINTWFRVCWEICAPE